MMKQSPFAALTGAEKQLKWLEYQSVRLPYIAVNDEAPPPVTQKESKEKEEPVTPPLPTPPPEIRQFQKVRHSQYDAVIARMKQAELNARFYRMP